MVILCLERKWSFLLDVAESFAVIRSVEGFEDWEDDVDGAPVGINRFRFGEFELVGNGEVTNSRCGRFSGKYRGCDRVDLHNKTIIDKDGNLINCTGKVYMKRVFFGCHNPRCPICYDRNWASREAKNIETRLKETSKRFGQVEHIICSVPSKDYGLTLEDIRRKAEKFLHDVGVIGGSVIFHGMRYKPVKGWYWSPHFHILGHILGGYRKCRRCKRKNNCLSGCGGFDDRRWQHFKEHGYYMKVADPLHERKTVRGTAKYQLSHATIKKDVKRFHAIIWFGNCSYRKLKVTPEMKKAVCPICQHDLIEWFEYIGEKEFCHDRDSPLFKRELFEDYKEGVDNPRINNVVWVHVPKKSRRSYLIENESPVRIFKGYDFDKLFRTE